ncbi:MAG: hypothetical protein HC769_23670 [Cyanobacteria bacterium CRU_2_1]|nr:hypothetical protein [Cyanobacteria bacterium CRU_2_1]
MGVWLMPGETAVEAEPFQSAHHKFPEFLWDRHLARSLVQNKCRMAYLNVGFQV